jgi:hypothetical protein
MIEFILRHGRWILLGVVTIVALFWPSVELKDASARLAALPEEGSGFVSKELNSSETERKQLGGALAIRRLIITDDGSRVILNIIDGTHNRHAVHDPAYCFAGAGWQIERAEKIELSRGEALFFNMRRGEQECGALCFFDDGKRQFSSAPSYWLRSSLRRLTLGLSGEEPILVLIRSFPGEPFSLERVRQVLLPGLGFQ